MIRCLNWHKTKISRHRQTLAGIQFNEVMKRVASDSVDNPSPVFHDTYKLRDAAPAKAETVPLEEGAWKKSKAVRDYRVDDFWLGHAKRHMDWFPETVMVQPQDEPSPPVPELNEGVVHVSISLENRLNRLKWTSSRYQGLFIYDPEKKTATLTPQGEKLLHRQESFWEAEVHAFICDTSPPEFLTCARCEQLLNRDEFHNKKGNASRGNKDNYCKKCVAQWAASSRGVEAKKNYFKTKKGKAAVARNRKKTKYKLKANAFFQARAERKKAA